MQPFIVIPGLSVYFSPPGRIYNIGRISIFVSREAFLLTLGYFYTLTNKFGYIKNILLPDLTLSFKAIRQNLLLLCYNRQVLNLGDIFYENIN
jgi:hypothetical protein